MKSRYFILATLAMALLAVSCQKAAVGGAQEPEEAPVPVQLTTNLKVNSVSVTKAGVDAWAEQDLYIYALPTSGTDELQIQNVKVSAPTSGMQGELTVKKNDGTDFYYPANSSTYDFYGYYVDDATTTGPSSEDGIYKISITLDGSQDVMLAKADKEEDTAEKGIAPTHAYSAYSARKGVMPNLKFEHQLARFVFRVAAGNELGQSVEIQNVSLTSNSKANLVITGTDRGIEDEAEPGTFSLKDDDGTEPFEACFPTRQISAETPFVFGDDDKIGESIMVIPADHHEMDITLQQKASTTEGGYLGEQFHIKKPLTPGMVVKPDGSQFESIVFLPGYQYNVNIIVYGRQEVKVSVTLSQWNEGGDIIIDNDKEWGDEPKLGLKATNEAGAEYYLYFYGNPIVAAGVDTPGTEVKFWNQTANKMEAPETGTYTFATPVTTVTPTLLGVTLTKTGDGENAKTTVTALVTEDPTPTN